VLRSPEGKAAQKIGGARSYPQTVSGEKELIWSLCGELGLRGHIGKREEHGRTKLRGENNSTGGGKLQLPV